jgi:uncharacterized phosphosugar-binding protein
MFLHVSSVARNLLPAVAAVNAWRARQAWSLHITRLLDKALERNGTVLDEIAAAMAAAIGSGHEVYAFGAGHSGSLVMEMHRRAGSLKVVRPIWNDELTSRSDADAAGRLESASGYYRELTGNLDWGPGDLCWVISNSGRNALVVELAQEAKRHGVAVIALTSVEHSTAVPPAPGLPRLLEIADYVLDNAGRFGDASLDIPGLDEPMAPTSTIVGAALIHAAWAGAAERLVAAGHVPEVWGSANRGAPGGRPPGLAQRGPAATSSSS